MPVEEVDRKGGRPVCALCELPTEESEFSALTLGGTAAVRFMEFEWVKHLCEARASNQSPMTSGCLKLLRGTDILARRAAGGHQPCVARAGERRMREMAAGHFGPLTSDTQQALMMLKRQRQHKDDDEMMTTSYIHEEVFYR